MQESQQAGARRVLLAGGGTGGHVYPALAIVEALRRRDPELAFRWLGSERIEARLVPDWGIDFQQIDIRFSYRLPTPKNWGYYARHLIPLALGRPFRQALRALEGWRPDIVLATGGYVAAPVIWAAQQSGIPVALIEINTPAGLVNWWFAPGAWRTYAATPVIARQFTGRCSQAKVVASGYPALKPKRTRAQVCQEYGLDPHRRILLVMSGSLGSRAVHHAVRDLLNGAAADGDPRWHEVAVLHVAGDRPELMANVMQDADLPTAPVQYRSVGYLHDAVGALHASDWYLGRSGAATVGELIATGLPCLLLPDPQHADKQQYGNARVLVERGQGLLQEQQQVTGPAVLEWLRRTWEHPRLAPPPPAADVIADDLLNVWEGA
jgi:UDP-N-acetylglucosamine--N-acetylmuramyl-(pentapeptide) pyrophosphoryl-undecaprenol N-acetylglucosamine transferase